MGDQPNEGRISSRIFDRWGKIYFRQEILHRSVKSFSQRDGTASQDFWFRSRRVLQGQRQKSSQNENKTRGHCSQGKRQMDHIQAHANQNQKRAGPGRRLYWDDQVPSLWIQQTRCQKYTGDDNLWSQSYFGIQFKKTAQRKSKSPDGNRIKEEIKNKEKKTVKTKKRKLTPE